MTSEAQMKILNLCKGKTIKQALRRLEIMEAYAETRIVKLRVQLCGLKLGD